jgi:hypothetical protein
VTFLSGTRVTFLSGAYTLCRIIGLMLIQRHFSLSISDLCEMRAQIGVF